MVIAEARRTYTYLSLFGYRVDAVIANRLLPDDVTDPWFDRWRVLHADGVIGGDVHVDREAAIGVEAKKRSGESAGGFGDGTSRA